MFGWILGGVIVGLIVALWAAFEDSSSFGEWFMLELAGAFIGMMVGAIIGSFVDIMTDTSPTDTLYLNDKRLATVRYYDVRHGTLDYITTDDEEHYIKLKSGDDLEVK